MYDAIARGPRASGPQHFRLTDEAGRLEGPFNALVIAPGVGGAVQGLGSAIRFGSSLPTRLREIATLTVASAVRSDFEWYAHEGIGRAAGLTDEDIASLHRGMPGPSFDATDLVVQRATQTLVTQRTLAAGDADEGTRLLGVSGLVELVLLVGYYLMLDLSMRAFDTPLPSGQDSPFARPGSQE